MLVLLSEGSGLTSRQVAGRLYALGHRVEILSSTSICLTRFTRAVSAVHLVPRFGTDPFAWLDAAQRVAKRRGADLLFPTQEQVTVISARLPSLSIPTIAPSFASLLQVQDKISAFHTLTTIGAPQPMTVIVTSKEDLERVASFPAFVKRPVSTASSGVRRVVNRAELESAAHEFGLGRSEILAQAQVAGPLAMIQAVAQEGRLIAYHACLRVRSGVGGGAALKESVSLPKLRGWLNELVAFLNWHGGLSMDAIVTDQGPIVIDVNPRLVEPGNALAAGIDLVEAMLRATSERQAPEASPGRAGARTHQTLLGVLGAAERTGSRRAIAAEAWAAIFSRGAYAHSREELTPLAGDPLAALPVATVLFATLAHPPLWSKFHAGAVGPYAVTPDAWAAIVADARARPAESPGD